MLSLDNLRLYFSLGVSLLGLLIMLLLANGSNKGRSARLVWTYIFIISILLGGLFYLNSNSNIILRWFA